jgi:hypothetical protein
MFITSSRWNALRLAAGVFAGLFLTVGLTPRLRSAAAPYNQTFDTLGSGLPAGWTVYTGATATGLGTAATVNTATTVSWLPPPPVCQSGSGGQQRRAVHRHRGQSPSSPPRPIVRWRSARPVAVGDPGASFNFNFSTVGRQVSSISFLAQMLSVQTRCTGVDRAIRHRRRARHLDDTHERSPIRAYSARPPSILSGFAPPSTTRPTLGCASWRGPPPRARAAAIPLVSTISHRDDDRKRPHAAFHRTAGRLPRR